MSLELREAPDAPIVLECSAVQDLAAGEGTVRLDAELLNPRLWWPRGAGEAFLYHATMRLRCEGQTLDAITFTVGVRTVRMVRTPRDQAEEIRIPAGPLKNETMFVVNGRPVYYRGVNMAPMDILFGRIDDERIERQMRLVRDANVNLLRLWGGGAINRRLFYDLADRYGIMLWQEFPLGCTDHEGNEHYRDVLAAEAQAMVKTLRRHPSIVLWCGGNESVPAPLGHGPDRPPRADAGEHLLRPRPGAVVHPHHPVSGRFPRALYLRLLRAGRIRPGRRPRWVLQLGPAGGLQRMRYRGPRSRIRHPTVGGRERTLASPPRRGVAVSQGLRRVGAGATWLIPELIERYFGRIECLEDLCRAGQFLQAIGLQYLLEEMRRKWPAVPGTMPWCFNTPWTSFAGSFVVAYPDQPLPAYHALRAAYAPRNVSARLESFVARPGRRITASVFLCDDGSPVAPGLVTAEMAAASGEKLLHREMVAPGMGYMERAAIGNVEFDVPPDFQDVLCLRLCWLHDGQRQENAAYIGVSADASHSPCFRPLLALREKDPQTRLEGME